LRSKASIIKAMKDNIVLLPKSYAAQAMVRRGGARCGLGLRRRATWRFMYLARLGESSSRRTNLAWRVDTRGCMMFCTVRSHVRVLSFH
jgi:hypothetical protein